MACSPNRRQAIIWTNTQYWPDSLTHICTRGRWVIGTSKCQLAFQVPFKWHRMSSYWWLYLSTIRIHNWGWRISCLYFSSFRVLHKEPSARQIQPNLSLGQVELTTWLSSFKYQYTRKFRYQPRKWLFGQPARKLSVDPFHWLLGNAAIILNMYSNFQINFSYQCLRNFVK